MTESADNKLRVDVFLSLQRALLGEVFPMLRQVAVEWSHRHIRFICYVDGELTDDAESISSISAEVAADFHEDFKVEYDIVSVRAPERIRDERLRVFARREDSNAPDFG